MDASIRHDETVRRAALPEVMFGQDIAIATQLSLNVVEAQAPDGYFGPPFYIDGRVAVLREDFLETMTLRASRRDVAEKEVLPGRRGAGR